MSHPNVIRLRYSFSTRGTRKARVLPDPVFAAPKTSRPARACGMAATYISGNGKRRIEALWVEFSKFWQAFRSGINIHILNTRF